MADPKPQGRPAIGPQVWASVSPDTAEMLDEIAERTGSRRGDVIRRLLTEHAPAARLKVARTGEEGPSVVQRTIRPLAEMLAGWIGAPDDVQERRERFLAYRRAAGAATPIGELMVRVAGDRALAGHLPPESITEAWSVVSQSGSTQYLGLPGWQWRAQLWFGVLAELGRRDVSVAVAGAEYNDEGEPEFSPEPLDEPADEDEFA